MADATLRFAPDRARARGAAARAGHVRRRHRPPRGERPPGAARRIVEGLSRLDEPVVFPAHPRTRAGRCARPASRSARHVELRQPLGYLAVRLRRVPGARDRDRLRRAAEGGVLVPRARASRCARRPSGSTPSRHGANVLVDDDPGRDRGRRRAARVPAAAPRPSTGTGTRPDGSRARSTRSDRHTSGACAGSRCTTAGR